MADGCAELVFHHGKHSGQTEKLWDDLQPFPPHSAFLSIHALCHDRRLLHFRNISTPISIPLRLFGFPVPEIGSTLLHLRDLPGKKHLGWRQERIEATHLLWPGATISTGTAKMETRNPEAV